MKKTLLTFVAALFATVSFAQTELLSNGGFENWEDGKPTDWAGNKASNATIEQSADAHSGSAAVVVKGKSGSNVRFASNAITLKAGTYTFSAYAKAADETAAIRLGRVSVLDGGTIGSDYTYSTPNANGYKDQSDTLSTEWVALSYTFTLTASKTISLVFMNHKVLSTDFIVDDASLTTTDGGIDDGTDEGNGNEGEEVETYEAALTDAQGNWTFENTVMPEDLSNIWSQDSNYGMKASGYANNTKYVTESYLVSPAIILGTEKSTLTFEHVQKYGASNIASQLTLWIRENGATDWALQLTIPNYPDGSSWNYISSGDIDLSAYAGKTVQLGWRYTSSEDYAATWELKNVKITNAKAAEEAPTLKDASNTPETAYTIAQAIEIIKNKDDYDMSKKVYTKGIITGIKSLDTSTYKRAQYYIGDTKEATDVILVYNGYYLGGADFTSDDQIKVGDEVIVYGQLTLYSSTYGTTYEINQNNYIYSLNGTTDGIQSVSTASKDEVIYDLSGRRVNNATKGIYIINGKKVLK